MGSDLLQARVASSEARQKTTEERTAGECPGCFLRGGAVGVRWIQKTETFQTAKDEERLDYLLGFDTHMVSEWSFFEWTSKEVPSKIGSQLGRNALWRPRWTCWMPSWMAWCENLKSDKPSVFLSRSCGLVPCHVTTYQYQNEKCEKQCLWENHMKLPWPPLKTWTRFARLPTRLQTQVQRGLTCTRPRWVSQNKEGTQRSLMTWMRMTSLNIMVCKYIFI